ncbi:MAG: YCF48-related protein [Blastocatellia bacterium]
MRKYLTILLLGIILILGACKDSKPTGTWAVVDTGTINTFFELNFVNGQTAWITGWFEQGPKETEGWQILQTYDGGKTWTPMTNQTEQKIKYVYFVNEKSGWAINLTQDILATNDGGLTWAVIRPAGKVKIKYNYNNPGAATEMPDPISKLKFLNEKVGWAWGGGKKDSAVEQEGVFIRTVDGGKNWQKIEYPFEGEVKSMFFLNEKIGWASNNKSGLYKTDDGGQTWVKQTDDVTRPFINGIAFANEKVGSIVGDSYIGVTDNGGQTWKKVKLQGVYLNDVYWVNEKVAWAVGDKGKVMYTENSGQKWESVASDLLEPEYANITKIRFFDANTGWAYGNNGVLLHYELKASK